MLGDNTTSITFLGVIKIDLRYIELSPIIGAMFCFIAGILIIIFRKWINELSFKYSQAHYGFRFSKAYMHIWENFYIVAGLFAIFIGILIIFS